jgi:hypothetical protein
MRVSFDGPALRFEVDYGVGFSPVPDLPAVDPRGGEVNDHGWRGVAATRWALVATLVRPVLVIVRDIFRLPHRKIEWFAPSRRSTDSLPAAVFAVAAAPIS